MQLENIADLEKEIQQFEINDHSGIEEFRLKYLSKKGLVADLFNQLKDLPPELRKEAGAQINKIKDMAQEKFKNAAEALEKLRTAQYHVPDDLTLLSDHYKPGARHPVSIIRRKTVEIFRSIGFEVADGPEIEDDWHNFSALNFPLNHPARDMQDTFFIQKNPDLLLRTHTSTVQVRLMNQKKPPIRAIMPGRVYRNEAISARAHCLFHQVEGLYINTNVSFKDLKDTLYYFVKEMFGKQVKIRFRPSFFPFTEPSAEIDISCLICQGKGCNICKHSGWVEIGGAGMVHPNVLSINHISPEEFTGFAFGMGLERITMLKYQIRDLRLFTENDVRFLNQFSPIS